VGSCTTEWLVSKPILPYALLWLKEIDPAQFAAADVDGSGVVSSTDALSVLKMAVGLSTSQSPEWLWFTQATGTAFVTDTTYEWNKSIVVPVGALMCFVLLNRQHTRHFVPIYCA
jgi:hypothetical protein